MSISLNRMSEWVTRNKITESLPKPLPILYNWNWYFWKTKSMILCVFNTESRLINGMILQLECRGELKKTTTTLRSMQKKNLVKTLFHILKLFLSFFRAQASHVPTINSILWLVDVQAFAAVCCNHRCSGYLSHEINSREKKAFSFAAEK